MKRKSWRDRLRPLFHFIVYHFYYRHFLHKQVELKLLGLKLTILPTVMNPVIFKSGKFFAEFLQNSELTQERVLDMGTGSGILALVLAKKGAMVVAVDINPEAVDCTIRNARENNVHGNLTILQSNFFEKLDPSTHFDLILFTPAYLKGKVISGLGQALYGGEQLELLDAFVDQSSSYLSQHGRILMLLSSDADIDLIKSKFERRLYSWSIVSTKTGFFETFSIIELRRTNVRQD